ncbi:hypothetical protein [Geminocystis sp. NIES-3709]|uniref:hypothetical protein n=1 Tax=Geminocystis sp. NIES-3709 TaxID=1617448 RepID=UPI0005FCC1FA|nr:hypothetical protein [Geminocystis sp. NIES-3709]BAQ65336.1 hypothetical protein GM3709_2101 [Geminocystis sp. NIES-3709]
MNNSFFDPDSNGNQEIDREELAKVSPQKQQELKKIFILLITIGLVIGAIVSFGLIKVMSKFGLTEKTPQFERIQK